MADLRISELNTLPGADLATGDYIAVADNSASETRKITANDFINKAVTLLSNDTLPSEKVLFNSSTIPGGALVNGGIGENQLAAHAVTAGKLADNSSVTLTASLPVTGSFLGQIGIETSTNKASVWNGSAWVAFKAGGSVNAVSVSNTGPLNFSVTTSGDSREITAAISNATSASQFVAGPVGSSGSVELRAIAGADLPTATTTDKGGVIVNGSGLAMDGDTITINNNITAESTNYHIVQYNSSGLITDGRQITSADLPVATSTTLGVIFPGTGLTVDAAGELAHTNSIVSGSATKVSFDSEGHITGTFALEATDIPEIPADKLTSGTLDSAVFPNNGVPGSSFSNYSTTQFGGPQSTSGVTIFPTADYIGQFFWDESRKDLYIWSGTAWLPVTITSGELVFAGTYDAANNEIETLTAAGAAVSGFTAGSPLPAADAANNQYYFVVFNSGTGVAPAPAVSLQAPDQIVSNGTTWEWIDVSGTIAGNSASNIAYSATGSISASDVQAAITELDTEKLAKAGGTLTGEVVLGSGSSLLVNGGSIVFEGSTADNYETTLAAVDPTADRTITFPNVTGTVITTGDTGSVTNTMLAGSIAYSKLSLGSSLVNADISGSAAISYSKLALTGSVVNADIATGAAIAYSKLNLATSIVNADIASGAAIAYSKLSLTGNIVNADISGSANIADSKLATISTAGKVSGSAITSGTIAGSTIINTSGAITTTGVITDSTGNIRKIPQNSQTSAYTLAASDVGKHISITTGGITVPSSIFSVGDNVTIFNNSTSDQTITEGSGVTLRAGGSTATGNRTLANYGVATVLCVATDTFVITGTGLT